MLTYNTRLEDIVLPEYGRNIQKMVEHCLTIEDRAERTACAHSIVKTMSILFPNSKNEDGSNRKFWDHLNIISKFKLDIDWPFEVIEPDQIETHPEALPYDTGRIGLRQYGRNIEAMIMVASEMEPSPERDAMVTLIANQMKKNLLSINKDDEVDGKVMHDLAELSQGKIALNPGDVVLQDYNIIAAPTGKKKKKK